MKNIYSKISDDKLIAVVIEKSDLASYRVDGCPSSEYLQVCGRMLEAGVKVGAHKHIPIDRQTLLTQESWIVVRGLIKASIYDIDDSLLQDITISSGECVTLLRGGHSLESLEDNTLFYEIKNGPYFGISADKENIND
tara:strand:+ start:833 stop:1246 length:414 start_codon:yes stop_codon:yes gene_type:complete